MQKIWTEDLNKYFMKEDIKMNKKHIKKVFHNISYQGNAC